MARRTDIPNPGKRISAETATAVLAELKRQGYFEPLLNLLRDYQHTIDLLLQREFRTAEWPHSKREFMRLARMQGRAQAPMDIIRSWTALAAGSGSPPPEDTETQ